MSRHNTGNKPSLSFLEICSLAGEQLYEGASEYPLLILSTVVVCITLARFFFPHVTVPILNRLLWVLMFPVGVLLDLTVVPVLRFINARLHEASHEAGKTDSSSLPSSTLASVPLASASS